MAEQRGITAPELVVGPSAHAAYWKAAEYFKIKLVQAPLGQDFRYDNSAALGGFGINPSRTSSCRLLRRLAITTKTPLCGSTANTLTRERVYFAAAGCTARLWLAASLASRCRWSPQHPATRIVPRQTLRPCQLRCCRLHGASIARCVTRKHHAGGRLLRKLPALRHARHAITLTARCCRLHGASAARRIIRNTVLVAAPFVSCPPCVTPNTQSHLLRAAAGCTARLLRAASLATQYWWSHQRPATPMGW
jgi:hypothetical protein